ncbi:MULTISPECIES: tyrosine-type recombinase/integrase [Lysinibacillus]|uniref:tyrosine-type recombinase/integrase n=1 Tax=Lysinibacillus TaxID=400634 RepID=UPI0005697884|nr:tyrosine-type recombinase/integrase [Lysinibacillus sphaericus]
MLLNKLKGGLPKFIKHLTYNEYAKNSIRSYQKDILKLIDFLEGKDGKLQKEYLIEYKKSMEIRLKPSSVNRSIAAVNKFLKFMEMDDFTLKALRIQEQTTAQHELTQKEFDKLIESAFTNKKTKTAMIMLTLAYTGIRIGELQFITVEAIKSGKVLINNKGTVRTIVIHKDLQGHLSLYCKEKNVKSGIVFTGSKGSPISRSYIARAMKEVAEQCGVDPAMVFPHNLRHYFARSFLDCGNPLSDLADILGHKSIDTTRRYLKTSAETKQKQLAKLKIIPNWQKNYGFPQKKIM